MTFRGRVACAATLLVLAGWAVAYVTTAWDGGGVELSAVRSQGVVYLEDDGVFLVADGRDVLALSAQSPGRDGRLLYCASLQSFHGPHGEGFNLRGEYFAGPAQRDMDRFGIEISGGRVDVDLADRTVAAGRSEEMTRPLARGGRLCSGREGEPGFALPPG